MMRPQELPGSYSQAGGLQQSRDTNVEPSQARCTCEDISSSFLADGEPRSGISCSLWERYPAELIEANQANGWPVHRQKAEFTPQRLYLWVLQLMGNYQRETGRKLCSHDFRRAAFTRSAEENVHPKRAAAAFDVTPETMLRYYTATEKKKTSDEVLGQLAGKLLLQPKREQVE